MKKLYWNTVSPLLADCLRKLMAAPEFDLFRLIGGTALSLQLGHRISVDIDLFSDAAYGTLDFDKLDAALKNLFPYVDATTEGPVAIGRSYFLAGR